MKPTVIFGTHDQSTIDQITRCAKFGEYSVLCADGHKGMCQPIGGVVAYAHHISVSGVGPDIGCFTEDTRIITLDGTNPTLSECVNKEVWILACAPDGKIVPSKGVVKATRSSEDLLRVNIDNSASVRCTPDHLFLLRKGNYKRADQLQKGDSLMPLYSTVDGDGYLKIRDNAMRGKHFFKSVHRIVFDAGLVAMPESLRGERITVHHKNFNKQDNSPENLEVMTEKEHASMHASLRDHSHMNTPEFTRNRLEKIDEFWLGAKQNRAFMATWSEKGSNNLLQGKLNNPKAFEEHHKTTGKRGAQYLIAFNKDPETIRTNKELAALPRPCPLCGAVMRGTSSLWAHAQKKHPTELAMGLTHKVPRGQGRLEKQLMLGATNHKVVSVERLAEKEDVYCLEVPRYNNFALEAGVFVHNCGNMAVRTDANTADVQDRIEDIMREITKKISFGVGRFNDTPVEHELFNDEAWNGEFLNGLKQKAKAQLGTVGSSNHYVDIFMDEAHAIWIGVHFGSRGLGFSIAQHYLKAAGGKDNMDGDPVLLDVDSASGASYIKAMHLAGRYAYAGREWVVNKVLEILGAKSDLPVHNNHNLAWHEEHFGEKYWVVRKGATPALPGQLGFVGGSMGDDAVILRGVESELSRNALYSTVHGAGRIMSRTAAKGKFVRDEKGKKQRQQGLVRHDEWQKWLKDKGVCVIGGDLDEAPQAYRRLDSVLEAHAGTIEIIHRLRPIGVAMAGRDVTDPYSD